LFREVPIVCHQLMLRHEEGRRRRRRGVGTLTEEGAVGSETGPVRGSCATEAAVGRECGRSGGTSGSVHVRGAVASAISAVRIGSESPVTRPEGKEKAESQPTVAKSRPGL
jgi:hypothetical protein